jgi:Ser/Thr protein kinase RdoA (MazF antagonist)
MRPDDGEVELTGGGRASVRRRGDVVVRDTGPWTPAVHALLRHLDAVGFTAAPRLVGTGIDENGRETLTFLEGEFTQPGPWSLEGAAALGRLLRDLHAATATFRPDPGAVWFPWHGRHLGGPARVIGHCGVAPWNIVARDGLPVGLIDWETAGPVDPLVELAQLCWLSARASSPPSSNSRSPTRPGRPMTRGSHRRRRRTRSRAGRWRGAPAPRPGSSATAQPSNPPWSAESHDRGRSSVRAQKSSAIARH